MKFLHQFLSFFHFSMYLQLPFWMWILCTLRLTYDLWIINEKNISIINQSINVSSPAIVNEIEKFFNPNQIT